MQITQRGFTLIELSIVLVIIGLIVGGVLVGRDLIAAAATRAQVSQIEKLNSAVNTFKGKYNGYLPGDIPEPYASQFGFVARGQYAGQGDGNSLLEGCYCNGPGCNAGFSVSTGETGTFWVDMTFAKLIDGNFNGLLPTTTGASATPISIGRFLPEAKIGNGNYLYVYGNGYFNDGANYFGLSSNPSLNNWYITSKPGLTVSQAYNIDKKIDDGLPQAGKVMSMYYNYPTSNFSISWAAGGGAVGTGTGIYGQLPSTAATPASATTCYDNNNTAGATQQYSIIQNNGAGVNCALSFQFQ